MHSWKAFVVCLFALTVSVSATPVVAPVDPNACIWFMVAKEFFSPRFTFAVFKNVTTDHDCAKICAADVKCMAFSRDIFVNECALKNDAFGCYKVSGVVTGIKYVTKELPNVKDITLVNGYTIIVQEPVFVVKSKPSSNVVVASASASASSSGNGQSVSFSSAEATPDSVKTTNFVSGNGKSVAYAQNPHFSLKTAKVGRKGALFTTYKSITIFKDTKVVAECTTISGKVIHFVDFKKERPTCFTCADNPCVPQKDQSFRVGGEVFLKKGPYAPEQCCAICRQYADCLSWYYQPQEKYCVLVKNVPEVKQDVGFVCGTRL